MEEESGEIQEQIPDFEAQRPTGNQNDQEMAENLLSLKDAKAGSMLTPPFADKKIVNCSKIFPGQNLINEKIIEELIPP